MKFLYLIALISICVTVNAQSTRDLDSLNGYSIFKFGTSASDIKNIRLDTSSILNSKNFAVYQYTGDSLKSIFNVQVSGVSLLFSHDHLTEIVVKFGTKSNKYTLEEFNRVQQAIEAEYGKYTGKLAMSGAVLLGGFRWRGKNRSLEHTRFTSTSENGKSGSWTVGEVSFAKKTPISNSKK